MRINADLLRQRAKEIRDALEVLDRYRTALAERLGQMARFRNLLVPLYWQVDDAKVWEVLRHDLGDLETYLATVGDSVRERL